MQFKTTMKYHCTLIRLQFNKQPTTPSADRKQNWIDFNAAPMLDGEDLTDALLSYVIRVADGEKTKNEANKYEEISIFKDGVTL